VNIYEQQASNRRTTAAIMAAFVGFFLFLGLGLDFFYLGFEPGKQTAWYDSVNGRMVTQPAPLAPIPFATIIALLFGGGMALNSYFNGPSMVLRSTMARRADGNNDKERQFLNVVAEMATASGHKPPGAYVIPDDDLNAFAAGTAPENAVIAVTQGLLDKLDRGELQAVVAHEMAHIRNYDVRLMTVLAAMVGAVTLLSDFAGRSMRFGGRGRSSGGGSRRGGGNGGGSGGGPLALVLLAVWVILIILAPLISRLMALAVSRQREFLADAGAAELTRNPLALISALEKIRAAVHPTGAVDNGVAHMCITDPRGSLIEEKVGLAADLLATHPPMEKRILALKVMAYQKAQQA
jgi:heat shock protein HtpX